MSGSTSSDDDAMMLGDDDRFKLFLDDAISDDEDDVDEDEDAERGIEEDDDDSSTDDDHALSDRYRSLRRNLDLEDEDDLIDDDDDDLLDDEDEEEFRRSSFPAPMPWPPAIVSQQNEQTDLTSSGKKKKPGIVYLSSIPTGFNVARTITFFSQFGKVGRVFLQPDLKEKAKRRDKMARNFTEGWIEFLSKRAAKEVANNLNNAQVGGSKRSKAHDVLWNIKYLPRFKWTHLSERLAYERNSHTQKMRTEVSQAKREADFYRSNVEKSRRLLKRPKSGSETASNEPRLYEFRQKETDDFLRSKKMQKTDDSSALTNTGSELTESGRKNKKKKDKKKVKEALPRSGSHVGSKSRKSGKKSSDVNMSSSTDGPPSKRARTRSSDRKEFLQSVFGAKT